MSMNVLAIAGNFFLFIEGLEKFQVVYGTSQVSRTIQYQGNHNVTTFTVVPYHDKIKSLYPRGQTARPFAIDFTCLYSTVLYSFTQ